MQDEMQDDALTICEALGLADTAVADVNGQCYRVGSADEPFRPMSHPTKIGLH
jgi:hypothetical protein